MSATGLKVPKIEVEEEEKEKENEPPFSSLIPNMSSVRSATSASTSEPASARIPMAQAPPTDSFSTANDHVFQEMKEELFQLKEELCQGKEELRKTLEEHCQMKEDFFQGKEDLRQTEEDVCQMKKEMAKLTNAFDRKAREMGDFRFKIQAQLNTTAPASARVSVAQGPPTTTRLTTIEKEFREMKEQFSRINEEFLKGKEELRQTNEDFQEMKEQFCHISGDFLMTKGEFLQMKGEFLQMKGELCQGNEEMAKLANAFDKKTKEIEDSFNKIQTQVTIQTSFLNTIPPPDAPMVSQNLSRFTIYPNPNPYGPPASFMPQQPMGGSIPRCFPTPFNSQPSFNPAPVMNNPAPRVNQNLVQVPIVSNLNPPTSPIRQKPIECSPPSNSQDKSSESAQVSPPVHDEQPVSKTKEAQCFLCNDNTHSIWNCDTFNTVAEQRGVMKLQNRCLKCLLPLNHAGIIVHPGCFNRNNCTLCNGNDHRSIFCENRGQQAADKAVPATTLRFAPY